MATAAPEEIVVPKKPEAEEPPPPAAPEMEKPKSNDVVQDKPAVHDDSKALASN